MIPAHIERARQGIEPAMVKRLPSGWVLMANSQFLPGYCILFADPVKPSLNDLNTDERAQFLHDMAIVGDAILTATGAERINYAILGNSEPCLHAHICPRFANEDENYRHGLPWSYPQMQAVEYQFNELNHSELRERILAQIERLI